MYFSKTKKQKTLCFAGFSCDSLFAYTSTTSWFSAYGYLLVPMPENVMDWAIKVSQSSQSLAKIFALFC